LKDSGQRKSVDVWGGVKIPLVGGSLRRITRDEEREKKIAVQSGVGHVHFHEAINCKQSLNGGGRFKQNVTQEKTRRSATGEKRQKHKRKG